RWSLANELGLVVVALYQKSLQLQYVEGLVDNIRRARASCRWRYGPSLKNAAAAEPVAYDEHFDRILKEAERGSAAEGRRASSSPKPLTIKTTSKPRAPSSILSSAVDDGTTSTSLNQSDDTVPGRLEADDLAAARAQLKARAGAKGRRGSKPGRGAGGHGQQSLSPPTPSEAGGGKKEKKKGTVWHDGSGSGKQLGQKAKEALDRSKREEGDAGDEVLMAEMRSTYMPEDGETAEWDEPESDLDEDDILDLQASENADENKGSWAGTLLKTSLGGFIHGLTGTKV
ncbi:unnamed protein product, partial [Ectocarpus sp. 8 AP-2014]